jgi:hypothetical protein
MELRGVVLLWVAFGRFKIIYKMWIFVCNGRDSFKYFVHFSHFSGPSPNDGNFVKIIEP